MVLSREEKEKMVLDLYYNKGYTYKQLTRELRMSPNQLREIIKRHEDKNDAIANKKKMLSLSSQAYKLFYEGKNNVEVAIKLDLPQEQITRFRLEYWRLRNQSTILIPSLTISIPKFPANSGTILNSEFPSTN